MDYSKMNNRKYLMDVLNPANEAKDSFREVGSEISKWIAENNRRFTDEIVEEISTLHDKKNNDYGGAYYEMLEECGTAAGSGIIYNKARRFANLVKNSGEQMVKDESIEDTLLDLASYAIMTLEHIRGLK
jgi:hypothetical protein